MLEIWHMGVLCLSNGPKEVGFVVEVRELSLEDGAIQVMDLNYRYLMPSSETILLAASEEVLDGRSGQVPVQSVGSTCQIQFNKETRTFQLSFANSPSTRITLILACHHYFNFGYE